MRNSPDNSLPFYQDKLHEEKVFQRFNEILTKVSPDICSLVEHRLINRLDRTVIPGNQRPN